MESRFETKVCFYVDDEETPYLVKIPVPVRKITLRDLKRSLQRTNYKFFFKSHDVEFGMVKEEIVNDDSILPSVRGRVISWLVTDNQRRSIRERPRYANQRSSNLYEEIRSSETDQGIADTSSIDESETTSIGRTTITTRHTYGYENWEVSRYSGDDSSSIGEECSDVVLVRLQLKMPNLGIQIQTSMDGEVVVDSIVEGGTISQSGMVEIGDALLQINGIPLCDLSTDEAVRKLREAVNSSSNVELLVSKRNNNRIFNPPTTKLIRPIDPEAWVAHTEAALGDNDHESFDEPQMLPIVTDQVVDEKKQHCLRMLADMMAVPNRCLELQDRCWLKMSIEQAFLGVDLINWITTYLLIPPSGARRLAQAMLSDGICKHPTKKTRFYKQRIYVFSKDVRKSQQAYVEELSRIQVEGLEAVEKFLRSQELQVIEELKKSGLLQPSENDPILKSFKDMTSFFIRAFC